MKNPVSFEDLRRDHGGAAVEFVLIAPLFIALIFGLVLYGGWYWLANSVQSLASEAARAAVGGLDADEQMQLARSFVEAEAGQLGSGMTAGNTVTVVRADDNAIRVEIAYDASQHPIFALSVLTPRPPTVIRRSATVRIGGY